MGFMIKGKTSKVMMLLFLATLLYLSAEFLYLRPPSKLSTPKYYRPLSSVYPTWEKAIHCSNTSSVQNLNCSVSLLWEQTIDFTCFSNVTGTTNGCNLVPNWIHFIRWEGRPMSFIHMICILAAFKHQKPERIFFHGNTNTSYRGKYWKFLAKTPGFLKVVEWHYLEPPESIFGQEIDFWWRKFHGSDIERIRIISNYGGIYLDNDCYLVKSIDYFRKYEITMNWDENQSLGSQVIIAHKDARFLTAWLETYRGCYHKDRWYYNAGERPTTEVLIKHPELLHRVKVVFGADKKYAAKVMHEQWDGWRNMYIIHLLNRLQRYRPLSPIARYPVTFSERNILNYPITLQEMANHVYPLKGYKKIVTRRNVPRSGTFPCNAANQSYCPPKLNNQ